MVQGNKAWTLMKKKKESIATHRGSNQWEVDFPTFWTEIESFLLAEKYQGPNSLKTKWIVKSYISSTAVTSEQRQQNLSRKKSFIKWLVLCSGIAVFRNQ